MGEPNTFVAGWLPGSSHKGEINLLEHVRRYKQLESAISQGQKKTVESLLEAGAPVNCHHVCHRLRTPLHSSVHLGDPGIVAKLLSKGANVNVDYFGDTPLTLAAKLRKFETVDLLLLAKDLENCDSFEKITHLHVACMRNRFDVAQKLLQCEKDVNAAVDCKSHYWPGFTPLHFAVQFECLETIEFLLNVGVDFTVKDAKQCTALHLAYALRHEQIVDRILLAHERIVCNPVDSTGLSHFHIACMRNKPKIVEHFIHLGMNLQDPILGIDFLRSWHKFPFLRTSSKTILDLAIQHVCVEVVELFLQFGMHESLKEDEEFDCIRIAYSTGNPKIHAVFTEASKLGRKVRKFESNYFDLLTQSNDEKIIEWTTKTPINFDLPITPTGCTVLHSAIEHGNETLGKLLVIKGADYTVQDNRGKSPLHLAFEHNMNELVDLMLEKYEHFSKNIVDINGLSHFHIACARDHVNAVKFFLKLGADVNGFVNFSATFWAGYTPLHFTGKFGSTEVAQFLLRHGANYSMMNASYLSAFDVAFLEAMKNSKHESFYCMELILKTHLERKDGRFNDRGVSLLHLACVESGFYPGCLAILSEFLDILPGDINKTVHKMGTKWDGYTPLHIAVQRTRCKSHAEYLIMKGADVLLQDANGDTPLHLATIWNGIRFPISQELNHFRLNHIGTKGFSIFHSACIRGDLKLMKYFLDRKVDPNLRSLDESLGYVDKTPLHLVLESLSHLRVDAVKLLLKYGADPNARDSQMNTPLHVMDDCCAYPEIIDILVSQGADVNARNARFETPLTKLFCTLKDCTHLCYDIIELITPFLNNGADIDLANKRGITPLSVANTWANLHPSHKDFSYLVKIIDVLLKHIIKFKTIGKKLSQTNEVLFPSLLSSFTDKLSFNKDAFIQECTNEATILKQVWTDKYTTLYDIVLGRSNKLAVMSVNNVFQNLVKSNDFCKKYPAYGSFLKSQLQQGRIRSHLLNKSIKALNLLMGVTLPRVCCEIILESLDKDDLRKLILSTEKNHRRTHTKLL